MLTKLSDSFELFFLISSKKFQANTRMVLFLSAILSLLIIGIFTPGTNFPCFNLLSSTIKSISEEMPKKFNAVVAFAGEP